MRRHGNVYCAEQIVGASQIEFLIPVEVAQIQQAEVSQRDHQADRVSVLALVGFDGTSVNDFLEPTLSSVRQPFDKIAQAAVAELLRKIDGQPSSGQIVLPGELVIGGSSQRITSATKTATKTATKKTSRSRGRATGGQR